MLPRETDHPPLLACFDVHIGWFEPEAYLGKHPTGDVRAQYFKGHHTFSSSAQRYAAEALTK
jgi:hypothetical protein